MSRVPVSDNAESKQGRKNKNKLAARFNLINMFFVVFILAGTIVLCGIMIYNFADNVSRGYARSFTMESVDVISSHLNSLE